MSITESLRVPRELNAGKIVVHEYFAQDGWRRCFHALKKVGDEVMQCMAVARPDQTTDEFREYVGRLFAIEERKKGVTV